MRSVSTASNYGFKYATYSAAILPHMAIGGWSNVISWRESVEAALNGGPNAPAIVVVATTPELVAGAANSAVYKGATRKNGYVIVARSCVGFIDCHEFCPFEFATCNLPFFC